MSKLTHLTRRESYEEVKKYLGKEQLEIVEFLRDHLEATPRYYAQVHGITEVHRIRPRFTELSKAGVIEAVGRTNLFSDGKREEVVWRLIPSIRKNADSYGQPELF